MSKHPQLCAFLCLVLVVSGDLGVLALIDGQEPLATASSSASATGGSTAAATATAHASDGSAVAASHAASTATGDAQEAGNTDGTVSELSTASLECFVKQLTAHQRFSDMAWLAMVFDTAYSAYETRPNPYIAIKWFEANRAEFGPMTKEDVTRRLDGAVQAFKSAADTCSLPLDLAAKQSGVASDLGRRLALFGSPTFTAVGWGLAIGAVSTIATAGLVALAVSTLPVTAPVLLTAAVAGLVAGATVTPVLEGFLENQAVKLDPELAAVPDTDLYETSKTAGELLGGLVAGKIPYHPPGFGDVALADYRRAKPLTRMFRRSDYGGLVDWIRGTKAFRISSGGGNIAESSLGYNKDKLVSDMVTIGALLVKGVPKLAKKVAELRSGGEGATTPTTKATPAEPTAQPPRQSVAPTSTRPTPGTRSASQPAKPADKPAVPPKAAPSAAQPSGRSCRRFIECSSTSCANCKSGRETCDTDTCCCPGYCE